MPTDQLLIDRARSPARRPAAPALTVLFDLVAPIALYYGLRAAGVGIVVALVAGAAAPALNAIVQGVRSRHVDPLAVTMSPSRPSATPTETPSPDPGERIA